MVTDAQNTMAAIASYYADPEHTTLPTVDQLMKEEDLTTDFPVTIDGGPNEDIIVTVIDYHAECPKGNKIVSDRTQ